MSRDIKVEPIKSRHLDALLALCREHAAYEKADFRENGQVERWRSALFAEPATLHGWMATAGREPCGFMTVTVDYATWSAQPFAHMDCLYLREPYRGMGLGRVFLERLREFALARGCGWAEWQTPTDNALGVGFYQRMGATAKAKFRYHYDVGGRDVS
ncbi:GNAT family N-acetyltransferase [Streptomyces sp. NPDC059740]|uniref:GNAT family N-acetyltransferase n=1 Tax=Streptomyces sp. NPDC059740 TaxID=3346926 RepID=UPI003659E6D9